MIRITIETYPEGPGRAATRRETIELDPLGYWSGMRHYSLRCWPTGAHAGCRVRGGATLLDAALAALRALKTMGGR